MQGIVTPFASGRALARGDIIPEESWREMIRPARLADGTEWTYGAGVNLRPLGEERRICHGGAMPGYSAALAHYPERDLTVAVIANLGGARGERFETAVTRAWLGIPPPAPTEVPVSREERARVTGLYDLFAIWARVEEDESGNGLRLLLTNPGEGGPVHVNEPLMHVGDGLFVSRDDPEWTRILFPPGPDKPATAIVDAVSSRWSAVRRQE